MKTDISQPSDREQGSHEDERLLYKGHKHYSTLLSYLYTHINLLLGLQNIYLLNSVGQSSLQLVKTVHFYERERHLCLQVKMRIHVKFNVQLWLHLTE